MCKLAVGSPRAKQEWAFGENEECVGVGGGWGVVMVVVVVVEGRGWGEGSAPVPCPAGPPSSCRVGTSHAGRLCAHAQVHVAGGGLLVHGRPGYSCDVFLHMHA